MFNAFKNFIEWVNPFLFYLILGVVVSIFLDSMGLGIISESILLLVSIPIMYFFMLGITPILVLYSYAIYRSLRNKKYPVALGRIAGMISFIALSAIKPIDCTNSGSSVGACFCEGLFLPLVCLFYSFIIAGIITFLIKCLMKKESSQQGTP